MEGNPWEGWLSEEVFHGQEHGNDDEKAEYRGKRVFKFMWLFVVLGHRKDSRFLKLHQNNSTFR